MRALVALTALLGSVAYAGNNRTVINNDGMKTTGDAGASSTLTAYDLCVKNADGGVGTCIDQYGIHFKDGTSRLTGTPDAG